MKVVLFSETVPSPEGKHLNGIARHVATLKNTLDQLDCQCTVVAPGVMPHPDPSIVTIPGKRKKEGGEGYLLARPFSLTGRLAFSRVLKEADVYHAHHPSQMALYGALKARFYGIPTIFTWHTYYVEYAHFYASETAPAGAVEAAVRSALRLTKLCTAVIAPSEAAADYARTNAGLEETPMVVIPTAFSLPPERLLSKAARVQIRNRLRISPHTAIFTVSGRQGPEKGLDVVIRAFALLYAQYPDSCLVLAGGSGLATRALEQLVGELGITEAVRFAGHLQEELFSLYAESICLFSASCFETQGLTVGEAASCGRPAVVVNQGGVAEQVEDGVTGFVCPGTPAAFAAAAQTFLDNPRLAQRMGQAALARVKEYTPLEMGRRVRSVYDQYAQLH